MALITCKKCKKIIPSNAGICPYCGETDPGDVRTAPSLKQGVIRSVAFGLAILTLLIILLLQWSTGNDKPVETSMVSGSLDQSSCLADECPAGTKAVTVINQQEPFYSCKSQELSEYANYVLGLMIAQARYSEVAPEISPKTGEPVVQGKKKLALDNFRAKAGVSSFEEAISKCYRGRGNMNLVVLYSPKESDNIYVATEEDQDNKFWLPKSNLVKRSH